MQFLTSRAGSPAPFRPIRSYALSDEDLEALDRISRPNRNNGSAIEVPNGPAKPKVNIDELERQAEKQ